MLDVRYSTKFKRDFKMCMKRHYNMLALERVIDILRVPEALPEKNLPHKLIGDYDDYFECHVAPDWLLIYKQTESELFLHRTGTHSDLY